MVQCIPSSLEDSSPLLGDLRPRILPHRTYLGCVCRTSAWTKSMFAQSTNGRRVYRGKLVLLCMPDGKLRKVGKGDNRYKTSHAFSQNLRFETKRKARKYCAELLSYFSSLNPVAESEIMPEGSCCNYPVPCFSSEN